MKNPSFDDMFNYKNKPKSDEEMPDFLRGFAAKKKPDNSWTRFQEMCDRLKVLNEKLQEKDKPS